MPTTATSTVSLVIDLETLSRRPDAIITEIGVVAFNRSDFTERDFIALSPDILAQIGAGRHSCPETIAWHQSNRTAPVTMGDLTPKETCRALRDFITRYRPHRVWIQGPDFDRPILESFCIQFGDSLPWEFWRTRDTRTLWDAAFPDVKHDQRPHYALPDARATLADLTKALAALNRTAAA